MSSMPRSAAPGEEPVDWRRVLRRAVPAAMATLALLVGLGTIVVHALDTTWMARRDLQLTAWMAERRTGGLDALAAVGSSLADTFTVLGVMIGAITMLVAAGRRRHSLMILLAVSTEFLVFLAASSIVGRDRPDVDPLGSVPSTASFPSGHVAVSIALYGALAIVAASLTGNQRIARLGGGLTALAAVAVGLARVYEGVHHPSDVAGGVVLGLAALGSAAWACDLVRRPDLPAFGRPAVSSRRPPATTLELGPR